MNEEPSPREEAEDQFPVELPKDMEEKLEELPPQAQEFLREIVQTESFQATIRSPLPPPAFLKQYEEILPGTTDRFLTAFETQAKHRQKIETKLVDGEIDDQKAERAERKRGQFLGFAIGSIAIITGGIVAALGEPWPGGVIGCSGVAGLVSVFVLGRRAQQIEMEANHEEPGGPDRD